jgi:LacI family transcriptional regulator
MSIKKIQEITGFSYSTISRVLNGKAKEFRISDETCQSIIDAAEKLDYRPNILARSLRLRKTHTIGLIVPDIQNPFFGELSWRIEKLLREHGYSTILCNTNEIPENEEFYLKVLVDRQVDGIIISPIQTEEWEDLESIQKDTSIILIDRIFNQTKLPWVTSNNVVAAETVTDELINRGYTKIAYLGGTPDTYINAVRFEGYQNALKKNSIPVEEKIVLFQGYSPEAGEEMMRIVLKEAPDIQAVFCVNNLVFLGAMKVVQQYELNTDKYIMMSAFDIGRYCNIFKRPLVCANQDLQKLATEAVSLLIDKIDKKVRIHNQLILPIQVDSHRTD